MEINSEVETSFGIAFPGESSATPLVAMVAETAIPLEGVRDFTTSSSNSCTHKLWYNTLLCSFFLSFLGET